MFVTAALGSLEPVLRMQHQACSSPQGNLSQSAAEKNKDLKEEHHNLFKLQENILGKSLR